MRLLRVQTQGFPAFHDLDFQFITKDRVYKDDDCVYSLGDHLYLNKVTTLTGYNASGKSTLIELMHLVCDVVNNHQVEKHHYQKALNSFKEGMLTIYMLSNHHECLKLISHLRASEKGLIFTDEKLYKKTIHKNTSKAQLFHFSEEDFYLARDEQFYCQDVSIMIAYNQEHHESLSFMIDQNLDTLQAFDQYPDELLHFLANHLDYLHVEHLPKDVQAYTLKLKDQLPYTYGNLEDVSRNLSRGTIKAINLFMQAKKLFEKGGIMIVDDLGNHLNNTIALTLLNFFKDPEINKAGAALLFTTHDHELMDACERYDAFWIVRKKKDIDISCLTNETKEKAPISTLIESGYLGGTSPQYEKRFALMKYFMNENMGL